MCDSSSVDTLVWVDMQGNEESLEALPDDYAFPRISPDGTKVALNVGFEGNEDIFIWDITRKILDRLTFNEGNDISPVWTPDGKRIIFRSTPIGEEMGKGKSWTAKRPPVESGLYFSEIFDIKLQGLPDGKYDKCIFKASHLLPDLTNVIDIR